MITEKRKKWLAWAKKRHEESPTIKCACGCGDTLKQYSDQGYSRKYIHGHAMTSRRKHKVEEIQCACGCGASLISVHPVSGMPRRYIKGHHKRTYSDGLTRGKRYRVLHKNEIDFKKKDRYRKTKIELVKFLGGSCSRCGLRLAKDSWNWMVFDFHHRNPKDKEAAPASLLNGRSYETLMKEITKCDLVCSNCHRVIHFHEGENHVEQISKEEPDGSEKRDEGSNKRRSDYGKVFRKIKAVRRTNL
jgi:hypothetical protein